MRESGVIIITDEELEDSPLIRQFGFDVGIRNILRGKGLPMKGIFHPEMDLNNYRYQRIRHPDQTTEYKFVSISQK